jgi:Ca2+-binding RTX toxin-like protein
MDELDLNNSQQGFPHTAPPPQSSSFLTETRDAAGNITLTGTAGDDAIHVHEHRGFLGLSADGVTVEDGKGHSHDYLGEDANHLSIHGGNGRDFISVDPQVRNNLHLYGDGGNDRIEGGAGNDIIYGGAGRDYIDGREGNDTLFGEAGNDYLYGGRGNDAIEGGDGNDYLEGGKGNDFLHGNAGNDVVSGGRDDDWAFGDVGNDVLYGGSGTDQIFGGDGNDHVRAEKADFVDGGAGKNSTLRSEVNETLGSSIRYSSNLDKDGNTIVDGILNSAEYDAFKDRVEDDIDLMRATPNGQQLLGAFDKSGHSVTVLRIDKRDNAYAARTKGTPNPALDTFGNPGIGQDVTIGYDPNINISIAGKEESPLEVLYHEASHAYNDVTGTLQNGNYTGLGETSPIPNRERQAVGLSNQGIAFDNDGNPATPTSRDNPDWATERSMSRELGRAQRPSYTGPIQP